MHTPRARTHTHTYMTAGASLDMCSVTPVLLVNMLVENLDANRASLVKNREGFDGVYVCN